MKRIFWCAGILLLINATAMGQAKSKKTQATHSAQSGKVSTNKANNSASVSSGSTLSLNSTTNYPAKANRSILSSPQPMYRITDPIITMLDQRAAGTNIQFNKSGVVGMPKRAYGFANGRITLNPNGAVTTGTQTGSGTVGTGTSMATFGSIGAAMNVNGKSPYAGNNMWGNARNLSIAARDSSSNRTPTRNNQ